MGASSCKAERCGRLQSCEESDGEAERDDEKEVVDLAQLDGVTSQDGAVPWNIKDIQSPIVSPRVGHYHALGSAPPHAVLMHPRSLKRRRAPIEVTLVRQGMHWRTLGLLVSPDDNPQYLVIDDVRGPSLVTEWNKNQPEELRLHQGDQILAVNGVAGWWEDMLRNIQVQASKPGDMLKLVVI
mmetsp:Transcript_60173/g.140633  ORF Transcript_60173/g.140633 Transcript_60173/m.140633 type:complete len:183 (+) Transcript_60173:59-607(+)